MCVRGERFPRWIEMRWVADANGLASRNRAPGPRGSLFRSVFLGSRMERVGSLPTFRDFGSRQGIN